MIRRDLRPTDRAPLAALLEETAFFNDEEIQVAMELVDDNLLNGCASHYRFLVATGANMVRGYACWGPKTGTENSVDLYWIAVHPDVQGRGAGRSLLHEAEAWILEEGRNRIYVETSGRAQYSSTRAFYRACGFAEAARLPDLYGPQDDKIIFVKELEGPVFGVFDDVSDEDDENEVAGGI